MRTSNKTVLHAGLLFVCLATVALLGGGFGQTPPTPSPQPEPGAAAVAPAPAATGGRADDAVPAAQTENASAPDTTRADATPVRTRESWRREAEEVQREVMAAWLSGDQAAIAASQAKAMALASRYAPESR